MGTFAEDIEAAAGGERITHVVIGQFGRIVYALAGKDVTLPAAREWSRDQIDQGC